MPTEKPADQKENLLGPKDRLDLRVEPPPSEQVHLGKGLPPYSRAWADVVRPLTRGIFTLLGAVLLIPFLFAFVGDTAVRNAMYDWAKTILAPIVGFASAAVGYYYGTRAAGERPDESEKDTKTES